jgi:hypothetical protein
VHIYNSILATRFLAAARMEVTGPPSQRQCGDEGRRRGVVLSVCAVRGCVGCGRPWGAGRRRPLRFLLVHTLYLLVLFIRVLANQCFLYRLSEAVNEKYCYELHARSGHRVIIRNDLAKLQHIAARPKTRAPQDLSTHAKKSISLQKARK